MLFAHIKLAGFKSFADPVHIPVVGRLSGVVGPNGCGKSNVVDAIRWVMGERSASALRGEGMHDVIFNGNHHRPAMDRASVELQFHSVQLPIDSPWSSFNELTIKRQIYRNQTSDYFINQQKVRRRDVADLFLGTGLGPRSYAIIEQGMVSRIIEANPKELRIFLEEAAGVSKYKERRHETERRFETIRQNLERVEDIRVEVLAQVDHLREQAAIAEQYQTLQNAFLADQRMVAMIQWSQTLQQYREAYTHLQNEQVEQEKQRSQIAAMEREQIEKETEWSNTQTLLEEAQSDLIAYNAQVVELEQDLRLDAQRREHLEKDRQKLIARLAVLTDQHRSHQDDAQQLIEQSEGLQHERKQAEQTFQERQQEVYRIERERLEQRQRYEALHNEVMQLTYRQASDQQALTSLETNLSETAERRAATQSALDDMSSGEGMGAAVEMDQEQDALSVSPFSEALQELIEQQETLTEDWTESREMLETTEQSTRTCHERIVTLRQKESGLQDKMRTLERQLQSTEGVEERLSEWLIEQGMLPSEPLEASLRVQGAWKHAVYIVLADWLSVRYLAQWLITNAPHQSMPPAGVLLLGTDTREAPPPPVPKPGTLAQYIHLEDPAFSQCLVEILNHYKPCEDWQQAIAQREHLADHEYWISQEGIQVGRWQLRFPGDGSERTVHLENRQAWEETQQALQDLAEQLQSELDQQTRLQRQRDQLKQTTETQKSQLQQCAEKQRTLESQDQAWRFQQQNEREKTDWQRQQYQKTLAQYDQQIAQWQDDKAQQSQALVQWQAKIDETQASLLREDTKTKAAEQQLQEQREQLRTHELEVHRLQHQIEQLQRDLQRNTDQNQALGDTLEEIEEQLQDVIEQLNAVPDAQSTDQSLQATLELRKAQEKQVAALRHQVETAFGAQKQSASNRQKIERQLQTGRDRLESIRLKIQEAELKAQQFREHYVRYGGNISDLSEEKIPSEHEIESRSIEKLEQSIADYQVQMKALEPVNLAAIGELATESARLEELEQQQTDLNEALTTLQGAIHTIDQETRQRMQDVFARVNAKFEALFKVIFGGGKAEILLTGEEILDAGVILKAQPLGKNNASIHLLSGGEKALTAISLVFAFFSLNPAPFCVLDEVDAPLDEANTRRFTELIRDMSANTQFLVISHNRITMETMETLVGVTMHEPGISKVVSVDLLNH